MKTLFLAVQQCRVGSIGAYGNEWIATPNIDRLAADGITFDFHYSDAPNLISAQRAWRTGQSQTPGLNRGLDLGFDLIQALNQAGTTTVLIRQARQAAPPEFYAGWAKMFDARPQPDDRNPADRLAKTLAEVAEYLHEYPSWFVWLELDPLVRPWDIPTDVFEAYLEELLEPTEDDSEPIIPWNDPPTGWFDTDDAESWELLHRSYAAAMTTFDADFGKLLDQFQSFGWLEDANLMFTSDSGFALGEHGLLGPHRPWMHEEIIHIPWIIRLAKATSAGRRIAAITQPPDVMATLLALHGISLPKGVEGRDCTALWTGGQIPHRDAIGGASDGEEAEWYLRTEDRLLILPKVNLEDDEPREVQMYGKPEDRWEVNDLRQAELTEADELEAQLRARISKSFM